MNDNAIQKPIYYDGQILDASDLGASVDYCATSSRARALLSLMGYRLRLRSDVQRLTGDRRRGRRD